MLRFRYVPVLALSFLLCVFLSGCSLNTTAAPTADAGLPISGVVHGGQSPIVGAHVYLFAASSTGYGGLGIAASSSNASVSLLTSGTLDQGGGPTNGDYYVTTVAGGAFTITGDYTCSAGQQVYLYVLDGNPGLANGTNNTASGLMAALGTCPGAAGTTNDTFSSGLNVIVNEVSTVAAAYSFAGFATDALHVSSSATALAQVGIKNAFANATNLAGISTGVAATTVGNGTVPQAEINTLANILAACVNTTGTISGPTNPTACYTLFNNALSGGSSGAIPSDTATAAINIAHNPAANTAALYGLSLAAAPFGPPLTGQPNDFTLALTFSGGNISSPDDIAIDGSGNAWVSNYGANVTEVAANTGVATQYTGGGLEGPQGIAVDPSGNVWVSNFGNASVTKLNGVTGAAISGSNGYTGGGLQYPAGIAIDGSGNVWVGDYAYGIAQTNGVAKLNGSTGAAISGSTGYKVGGVNTPEYIAIDALGIMWDSNITGTVSKLNGSTGGAISPSTGYAALSLHGPLAIDGSDSVWQAGGAVLKLNGSTGAAISPTSGYTGGGISTGADAIAIDGAGNVWVGNYNYSSVTFTYTSTLSELQGSTGGALSPSTGYTGTGIANPQLAVDGSGNVWSANYDTSTVTEILGIAAPVVTPLSVGAKNNTLGTRP